MNMFISYLHGKKNFLALDVYCFTCIFKYPFFFAFHLSLINCPLLVTLIPVLSMAMIRYSSLETLSLLLLLLFILIFNLFILLFIVVKSGIDDSFPLVCPCAMPSVCLYGKWKYTLA